MLAVSVGLFSLDNQQLQKLLQHTHLKPPRGLINVEHISYLIFYHLQRILFAYFKTCIFHIYIASLLPYASQPFTGITVFLCESPPPNVDGMVWNHWHECIFCPRKIMYVNVCTYVHTWDTKKHYKKEVPLHKTTSLHGFTGGLQFHLKAFIIVMYTVRSYLTFFI